MTERITLALVAIACLVANTLPQTLVREVPIPVHTVMPPTLCAFPAVEWGRVCRGVERSHKTRSKKT